MNSKISGTLLLIAIFILSTACVTPRQKYFQKIETGMDKSSVLEIAGNPDKTQRWKGKDRWTYIYLVDDKNAETKEVHFEDGRVVYIGGKIYPAVSAEEQDRRNAVQTRIDEQATFEVPGSTYIQVIKPNWESLNPGEPPIDAPEVQPQQPKFEKIQ